MDHDALRKLLNDVKSDKVTVDRALDVLRHLPFEDLGFAKVDHHRAIRCGFPEVIYCEGKTTQQVVSIFERRKSGGGNVLATRAAPQVAQAVRRKYAKARYNELARTITLRQGPEKLTDCFVAVVCAGTSDMPVAEEARETLEIMDQRVRTFYDVGVAGIHRVLAHVVDLSEAVAVVVCAGMEGALPSVVGGLVASPVIAVPTSVGYGAHFGGLAPLLTMLNSCATGVSVVNIDNGFGAGYLAALIGRVAERAPACPPAAPLKKLKESKRKRSE
jgi:hypothetical protein